MKRLAKKLNYRRAFTIVELLTVMSIIMLLISLLVPSLNRVRRYALRVNQRHQFRSLDVALELFYSEWESYPDSGQFDQLGLNYCGAMKLCEAMVGQDLLGFHPDSRFRQDGFNLTLDQPDLYPARRIPTPLQPVIIDSQRERHGLYLNLENANAYRMGDIYDEGEVESIFGRETPTLPVLCDVYPTTMHRETGRNVGMPILYYLANASNLLHEYSTVPEEIAQNIYDYRDNIDLINLGLPWDAAHTHPMAESGLTPDGKTAAPALFYENTRNRDFVIDRPHNAESYILMSAGFDGLYGTVDDVFNFDR
ncbi:hypothetical protein ES703_91317 [subsurface metagenome]